MEEELCGQLPPEQDGGMCKALGLLDDPYTCGSTGQCVFYGSDPDNGYVNFNTFFWSALQIFQVTTLEGWGDTLTYTQSVMSPHTFFIFLTVILVMAFSIMNLVIAVLVAKFNETVSSDQDGEEERVGLRSSSPAAKPRPSSFGKEGAKIAPWTAPNTPMSVIMREGAAPARPTSMELSIMEASSITTTAAMVAAAAVAPRPTSLRLEEGTARESLSHMHIFEDRKKRINREEEQSDVRQGGPSLWTRLRESGFCYRGIASPPLHSLCTEETSWLSKISYSAVVLSLAVMAMDGYDISHTRQVALEVLGYILYSVFAAEMLVKVTVLGMSYFEDGFNVLDAFIVLGGTLELAMSSEGGGNVSSLRIVRMLRLARILRIGRITKQWESLHKVMNMISGSWSSMAPIGSLLLLLMYIYAVLGTQLFGTAQPDDEERIEFTSFHWSFIQVFFVLFGENWPSVMRFGMSATGSPWAALYFVTLIIIGNMFLLNIVLAVVLAPSSGDEMDESYRQQQVKIKVIRSLANQFKRMALRKLAEHARECGPSPRQLTEEPSPRGRTGARAMRRPSVGLRNSVVGLSAEGPLTSFAALPSRINDHIVILARPHPGGRLERVVGHLLSSLLGPRTATDREWMEQARFKPVRYLCRRLTCSVLFDRLMLGCVVLSTLLMLGGGSGTLDRPAAPDRIFSGGGSAGAVTKPVAWT